MNTFFKYKDENYLYYHVRLSQIYITLIIPVLRQMLIMCQMTMLKQIYIYLTSEGLYHMSLAPSEIKSSGNSSFWFVQFSIVTPTAFWTRDGEQNVQFQLKLSEVVKWHGNGKWQGSILCNFCRQQCNTRQRISKLLVMILYCVTHYIRLSLLILTAEYQIAPPKLSNYFQSMILESIVMVTKIPDKEEPSLSIT